MRALGNGLAALARVTRAEPTAGAPYVRQLTE